MSAAQGTEVQQGNTNSLLDNTRKRNFSFTSYKGKIEFKEGMKYLLQGSEICPDTGRPHEQGFVIFTNPRVITGVIKEFPGIHWEVTKKSIQENINYCKKDNNFTEQGEIPAGQGTRSDVKQITKLIKEGKSDQEILEERGDSALRMYKGIGWARTKMACSQKRNWEMDVRIYHGEPGTGKTRSIYKEFDINSIYEKPPGKWWDNYTGQPVVLIDDFDPKNCFDITFDFYLKLLDRYPLQVEFKGGFTNFCSKIIIFTSNFHPDTWFEMKENRSAFFRRIGKIVKFGETEEIKPINMLFDAF